MVTTIENESEYLEKQIPKVSEHIKHVQENCHRLGAKLIKAGKHDLALRLIRNSQVHDNSKFFGLELWHLNSDSELLEEAVKQHQQTNPHHPEYWMGGLSDAPGGMPEEFLLECLADWKARSSELGTDFMHWVTVKAPAKYHIDKASAIYHRMLSYAEMLLEEL